MFVICQKKHYMECAVWISCVRYIYSWFLQKKKGSYISKFTSCGLSIDGRLGFLGRGGAAGLTSGRLGCATSTPCWVSLCSGPAFLDRSDVPVLA